MSNYSSGLMVRRLVDDMNANLLIDKKIRRILERYGRKLKRNVVFVGGAGLLIL